MVFLPFLGFLQLFIYLVERSYCRNVLLFREKYYDFETSCFRFFSLLVGVSITLFERFAKWAKNAESGGYLRGVVL